MAKKNLPAKKKSTDLEKQFLNEVEGLEYDGFENIGSNSLSPPFLKIAQPGSPQIMAGETSHIKGLKAGDFLCPIEPTLGASMLG